MKLRKSPWLSGGIHSKILSLVPFLLTLNSACGKADISSETRRDLASIGDKSEDGEDFRNAEYKEWSSKIELPTFEILASSDFSTGDIKASSNLEVFNKFDDKKLSNFYQKFNEETENLLSFLNDPEEKTDLEMHEKIARYMRGILDELKKAYKDEDERNDNDIMNDLRTVITNNGYQIFYQSNRSDRIDYFTIGKITSKADVHFNLGSTSGNFPMFYQTTLFSTSGMRPFGQVDHSGVVILDANIPEHSDYIEVFQSGQRQNGFSADASDKPKNNPAALHEFMHRIFQNELNVSQSNPKPIKKQGLIDMGAYQLNESDYINLTGKQIHELVAHGYEISKSGNEAAYHAYNLLSVATTDKTGTYDFILEILIKELLHNSSVTPDLKSKLEKRALDSRTIIRLSAAISNEDWHAIGERMVKLGIYLIQE